MRPVICSSLILFLFSSCPADDLSVAATFRIGYLWPNGTVIVPVELVDGFPSAYTGDWKAFRQKQELLEPFLPPERASGGGHEFRYYETYFLVQRRGYESAGAALVRFDGDREIAVLGDGRFEGC